LSTGGAPEPKALADPIKGWFASFLKNRGINEPWFDDFLKTKGLLSNERGALGGDPPRKKKSYNELEREAAELERRMPEDPTGIWSGIVDRRDGFVERTFSYDQAADQDFHHRNLLSRNERERNRDREIDYFWLVDGHPYTWEGPIKGDLAQKIRAQIADKIKKGEGPSGAIPAAMLGATGVSAAAALTKGLQATSDGTRVAPRKPSLNLPPIPTIGPLQEQNKNQPDLSRNAKVPGVEYLHGDARDLLTQTSGGAGILDFVPGLGEARGVIQGRQLAAEGHPVMGAAVAGSSVIPGAAALAKQLLKKGLKVGPAAIRVHVPGEAKPRRYTGQIHPFAREDAQKELGDLLDDNYEPRFQVDEGFLASDGETWLERDVAAALGKANKQLTGDAKAIDAVKRTGRLKAEALSRGDAYAEAQALPVDDILQRATAGGFTFDPRAGSFVEKGGFAVANPPGNKAAVVDDITPATVQKVMDDNAELLKQDGMMLGGWRDGETGKFHLEISQVVPDEKTARQLMAERNEIAVWDLDNQRELRAEPEKVVARQLDNQEPPPPVEPGFGLGGYIPEQKSLEYARGPRADPDQIDAAYEASLKAFRHKGPYKKFLEKGRQYPGAGPWYDTRGIYRDAADVLGEEAAAKKVNNLLGIHMPSVTARSAPPSNLKRAFLWQQLVERGLVTPEMLRSSKIDLPAGFGHFVQSTAHQPALARSIERGVVDPIKNPKPASFGQNLTGNMKPGTFDTVMGRILRAIDPKTQRFFSGDEGETPMDWAYQPLERGLADAAEAASGSGLLDDVLKEGMSPTASYQSLGWHGDTGSAEYGSMYNIWDDFRNKSAEMWGVSPGRANEMIWGEGRVPLLPLDSPLIIGSTPRKKKK
jgi:hypothetical protein